MAQPWWVNLLIFVPFVSYFFWRKNPNSVTRRQLITCGVFAIAFGVVEGTVVVYLQGMLAATTGYGASVSEVARFSHDVNAANLKPPVLPSSVLRLEMWREAATMLMLIALPSLVARNRQDWWAIFLWAFAIWDLVYYATLWATLKWPTSLTDTDVLFLIPVPWISHVWFPLLVSSLSAAAVLLARRT